jgi:hypothetical protein
MLYKFELVSNVIRYKIREIFNQPGATHRHHPVQLLRGHRHQRRAGHHQAHGLRPERRRLFAVSKVLVPKEMFTRPGIRRTSCRRADALAAAQSVLWPRKSHDHSCDSSATAADAPTREGRRVRGAGERPGEGRPDDLNTLFHQIIFHGFIRGNLEEQ